MKATELREKTDEDLDRILIEATEDIMHFRLQMATGVVDNVRKGRQSRRNIARIKTILAERKRDASAASAGGGK